MPIWQALLTCHMDLPHTLPRVPSYLTHGRVSSRGPSYLTHLTLPHILPRVPSYFGNSLVDQLCPEDIVLSFCIRAAANFSEVIFAGAKTAHRLVEDTAHEACPISNHSIPRCHSTTLVVLPSGVGELLAVFEWGVFLPFGHDRLLMNS